MKSIPQRLSYVALVVSILALATSVFSLAQVRQGFLFTKTQALISKENELYLLLLEADRLSFARSRLLLDIMGTLERNPRVRRKHSHPVAFYKESMDELHNSRRRRLDLLLDMARNRESKDISFLEHSVGLLKLEVSHYAVSNEDLQRQLLELEQLVGKLSRHSSPK